MKKLITLSILLFLYLSQILAQDVFLENNLKMSKTSGNYPLPTLHIRNGLPNTLTKLRKNSPVTIAYLGGSITNHNGYRVYNEEWFRKEYPNCKITTVNAGIGGTGSDLGVFRLKDDVLIHQPDLVFVEFAVNDGNGDSIKISNSMEGIVRQIKRYNPQTDICFLYTINSPMLKDMEQGKLFNSMRLMEHIAEYYQLPSINFGVEVIKLMKADKLIFKGEKNKSYGSKIVFTDDNTHPTFNQGHRLYSEIMSKSINEIRNTKIKIKKAPTKPLYKDNFEYATMLSPDQCIINGKWEKILPGHPLYNMNKNRCPDLIYTSDPEASITFHFTGRVVGVYDIIGPNSCGFSAQIDGKENINVRRFDTYCHYYRNNYTLLPTLQKGAHKVTFKINPASFDKEDIVKKRYQDKITDKIRNEFKQNVLYIGKIMIVGTPETSCK